LKIEIEKDFIDQRFDLSGISEFCKDCIQRYGGSIFSARKLPLCHLSLAKLNGG
jgi:hypothetical protein